MTMPEQQPAELPTYITDEMLDRLHQEDLAYEWGNGEMRVSPESREHHLGPALWSGPETGLGWHRRGPNSRDW